MLNEITGNRGLGILWKSWINIEPCFNVKLQGYLLKRLYIFLRDFLSEAFE